VHQWLHHAVAKTLKQIKSRDDHLGATENRCVTGNNAQPRKIWMLGATLEPFYQVLEFVNRFNFRSRNPRIPAPLATPAMVGARGARYRPRFLVPPPPPA
jgi:hypothetical protein